MNDIFGNQLNLGDNVAVVCKNTLLPAQVVDFTPKQIRVAFDTNKYSWAIGYGYKYGVNKGKQPTLLVSSGQIVKQTVA